MHPILINETKTPFLHTHKTIIAFPLSLRSVYFVNRHFSQTQLIGVDSVYANRCFSRITNLKSISNLFTIILNGKNSNSKIYMKTLSTNILNLMLPTVCHFHQHFFFSNRLSTLRTIDILVLKAWIPYP